VTREELLAIIRWLEERVRLEPDASDARIAFYQPSLAEMEAAGLSPGGCRRRLATAWWDEMKADVVETPDFCEPGSPPQTVLRWARDVIGEWIRKRFPLDEHEP